MTERAVGTGPSIKRRTPKKSEKKRRDGGFLSGVMVLSLSAIAVKIIGLIYKIPMLGLLGSEGMGYFNSAYEIYALFCAISTAGLPIAASLLISRCNSRDGAAQAVFGISLKLFVVIGSVSTAIMIALAYPLAKFLGNGNGVYPILAIAPTLLFICAVSAYRGYFQGMSRMAPTAVSQLIEALGKLVFGIVLALLALRLGLETEEVAAFAVLGLLLGSVISLVYMILTKKRDVTEISSPRLEIERGIVKDLLEIAIPVTVSAAVINITKMVDMTMILRRLQSIGYKSEEAFSAYGSYTTLAVPLFMLAPALISSVALPIIPRLSRAVAKGDTDSQIDSVNDGIRLACIISMPIGAGLSFFSKPILKLIFSGQTEAVELCAPLLSMLGLSVTLSCLVTVGNSILHAFGHAVIPLVSMTLGAILKTLVAYILIGNPKVNIAGAPISTFACDLVINIVNFKYICKYIPGRMSVGKILVRPFLASIIAVVAARLFYGAFRQSGGSDTVGTLISIAVAGILYAVLCVVLRVTDKKELCRLRHTDAVGE